MSFIRSVSRVRNLIYAAFLLVACAVIAVPVYIYVTPARTNQLEEAIKQLRFVPITPPTTLRAPGTIYVVGKDGQVSSALCQADASQLKGLISESPTETQDAQTLRKASFALTASIEKNLKDQVKGDLVESVSFSLENVSVLEVSIANLRVLASELQKNTACADSVYDYLKAGLHICQGQQVLKATTKYSIQTKREVGGEVAAQLRDAVRANIDPHATVDGSTVTSGQGLFYGMRLAPLCMALPGQPNEGPPSPARHSLLRWIGL